ncbi:hypothetical protein K435DRAFT_403770 [Dendrothele bispora CBS 962.96]|uniref:Uncharacterized protein n=1 Tax=Dendrothele bispora (strain CBS 962.96) TaxID=1314807 RepID=A0A4S8L712_DENBC|nr:hypothetical protein K435DRAFT_403770 [Dendrothele bispora CBS 962.96]
MLLFYALALWDRWMHLKLKEFERLQRNRINENDDVPTYGATLRIPSVTPKPKYQERLTQVDSAMKSKGSSQYLVVPSSPSLMASNPTIDTR